MHLASLLLASLTLLVSCGGSSDPAALTNAGHKALGSKEFAAAQSDFDAALAAIGGDTSHPSYLDASLGAIEARAATDAAKAKDDLIALAQANPGKVTERDFARIADRMGSAQKFTEAVALLAEGKAQFPDSPTLDKLGDRMRTEAESAGATDALDALAGLGYVGDE